MSSAPSGIDVREYAYSYFPYRCVDGNAHFITARANWLVTKVQVYAAADTPAEFVMGGEAPGIDIAAGGCLTLEPNGAYRGGMTVSGQGLLIIVEYWYQTNATGQRPPVTVTPP